MVQLYSGERRGANFVLADGYEITPTHPGPIIKRWLTSQYDSVRLADDAKLPHNLIVKILSGERDIDTPVAVGLARAFGRAKAETLFKMQVAYNLFRTKGDLPIPESIELPPL